MGGAQPLAVTMNGGVAICIECDPSRISRRIEHGYLDVEAASLDEALHLAVDARDAKRALSIGVLGNAASYVARLLANDAPIDIVTDQTSAHDPLSYLPIGVDFDDWHDYAARKPDEFTGRAQASMARHVEAMVGFLDKGAEVFDYGNSIRAEARAAGLTRAFDFPGFVPAYIRPLFCEGKGPFRWVALSGDPRDIARTDQAVLDLFPENESLARWITLAQQRVHFQGLPARICWLGYGERDKAGLAFNDLVASGEVRAPIVIGRDHLDCGSVASPYRETESMLDGFGRHRRLAAAQRDGQRRQRRDVGVDPPRRRGRHRTLDPRRTGLGGGRDATSRRETRAGAVERSRDGRDPARRRRLRQGRRGCPRARGPGADAGKLTQRMPASDPHDA